MSVDDDLECISKIVQQSEKYICGEISKLHGELKNCNQSFRVCETKMKQQDVRIEKLECQVKAQDQKINILQTEKQNLLERVNALQTKVDNPNTHTDCKATMQKVFASALKSILPETNESVTDIILLKHK